MKNTETQNYWTKRYLDKKTGWDIGYPSTPIKMYIDQLTNKNISILIPGAGNGYEAEYLHQKGFTNVSVLDISKPPLESFSKRNPNFPKEKLVFADFFLHHGQYDLIFEQTFFCSFSPTETNRLAYSKKMNALLKPKGKLVGVWFDIPLVTDNTENRPFGGDKKTYLTYFIPYFKVHTFTTCYNSIPERANQELFGILKKL